MLLRFPLSSARTLTTFLRHLSKLWFFIFSDKLYVDQSNVSLLSFLVVSLCSCLVTSLVVVRIRLVLICHNQLQSLINPHLGPFPIVGRSIDQMYQKGGVVVQTFLLFSNLYQSTRKSVLCFLPAECPQTTTHTGHTSIPFNPVLLYIRDHMIFQGVYHYN